MEWIDVIERFNTFGKYPFATLIHWLVGYWCGCRLEVAVLRGGRIEQALGACLVFVSWMVYETTEYLTERDSPDVDIANGIGGLILGIALTHLAVYVRSKRTD